MSTVTIYPLKLKMLLISNISDISQPPYFFTYAVCWHDIKSEKVSFNVGATTFNMILQSTVRREIGRQFFCVKFISVHLFYQFNHSLSLKDTWLFVFPCFLIKFINGSFITIQKCSLNSFETLLSILHKT